MKSFVIIMFLLFTAAAVWQIASGPNVADMDEKRDHVQLCAEAYPNHKDMNHSDFHSYDNCVLGPMREAMVGGFLFMVFAFGAFVFSIPLLVMASRWGWKRLKAGS